MSARLRFAYRLALRLGVWDVPGWLESLPARALDAWWAYYYLEPWDLPREHWPDVRKKTRRRGDARTRRRGKLQSPEAGLAKIRQMWGV